MNLTPEQQELGRRNFLRVMAGTPALAALAAASAIEGPLRGGPVRIGCIGTGGQGRVLLEQTDRQFAEIVALCDINPLQLAKADESLAKTNHPPAKHYSDWKEMLQKEKLEAVLLASPLFLHAEIAIACMEAGLHVLSEKMMAWDVASCERIAEAAHKNRRVYEVGHQRFYNGVYQAAYEGIVKAGLLGELYHARLVWHRNGNWRRHIDMPSPDYDASRWGYPSYDHLINWRLYKKYSRGHMAELASHQVAVAEWFFGANATAAIGSGGVYRFKDGREIPDHTYVTLEYPGGRTVVFTSIESNAFDNYYEAYYGTKGTLILSGEIDAFLFEEKGASTAAAQPKATGIEITAKGGPVGAASESRAADAAGSAAGGGRSGGGGDRNLAYKNEVSGFCAAVRTGVPLKCGPERAMGSARACITGFEAMDTQKRIEIKV